MIKVIIGDKEYPEPEQKFPKDDEGRYRCRECMKLLDNPENSYCREHR